MMAPGRDRIGSRLPGEDIYWDGLAHRIALDADPLLQELHQRRGVWWSGLARGCPALIAVAVVATAAVSLTVRKDLGAAEVAGISTVERVVGPSDPLAQRLLGEAAPPRVEALLPFMADTGRNP